MRCVRILLSHDESTFKSGRKNFIAKIHQLNQYIIFLIGEVSSHRWLFPSLAPFFNKGRGRSVMLSFFIVQHDEVDLLTLNADEWNNAVRAYPELLVEDEIINYLPRSANAWIEPKKDNYFDNEVILRQFKRLFIILKFKKQFENCQFDIIVDNAKTHSAKIYDINQFNKRPGTQCVYKTIEWIENGETKTYFFLNKLLKLVKVN